ncbi:MAG: hypothetical protein JNM61_12575 [Zoogloeaceae bacterium]|nr:hypothetical protein [Zoogloeaceae bacterium]
MRRDEAKVARILADCSPAQLDDFDEFLSGQGLKLRVLDGLADLSIPPTAGRPSTFYVLARRFGEDAAPFIDTRAFLNAFRDRRHEKGVPAEERNDRRKAPALFWAARFWLTLQFYFYDRIDRPVGNLYAWRDALVRESDFIELIKEGVETLGNQGRPEGESGILWDTYWNERNTIPTRTIQFLNHLKEFGMIEETDEDRVYRQSLVAAVDMETIAEHSLRYLMPAESDAMMRQTRALLSGYPVDDEQQGSYEEGADHAADSPN